MKRKSLTIMFCIVASAALFSVSSCSDWLNNDKPDYDQVAFGTITLPAFSSYAPLDNIIPIKECVIVTDDSLWLYPTNISELSSYKAIEGQRVIVYYKVDKKSNESSRYTGGINKRSVNIASIQNILTKSILNTNRIDTVKNDPATLYDAYYGSNENTGKRYLNIYFVASSGLYKPHFIYLVNDLSNPNPVNAEGYYCLELRHDANNDVKQTTSGAYVSFILDEACYAPGIKGIRIKYTTEFNETREVNVPFSKAGWAIIND